jgi:uncharacterized Ntn-hydrolase superfamily protein
VSNDDIVRAVAVVAAVALVAAPYHRLIVERLTTAAAAAQAHGADIARIAAALLIVAALWGKVPVPTLPGVVNVPAVVVPEPTPELQRLVAPVADALASVPADKRQLWAATWAKAAVVVEAEGSTSVAVFTDTPSLRAFTGIALDVAWRRLGNQAPGSVAGLKDAVEAAMRGALGLDSVPVTADTRARYADVAKAIAWAGTR